MNESALRVLGLRKNYKDFQLQDVSFSLPKGFVMGLVGPNGAGKTTTMRMILDIVRPMKGRIAVFGEPPGVEHQARVGYLPEDRGLYRDVKIIDTLTYFGSLRGMSRKEAHDKAMALLTEMELADAAEKKAAELTSLLADQNVSLDAAEGEDADPIVDLSQIDFEKLARIATSRASS